MISTPGMTGCPGKWPWKNGSLMVTFLMPDHPAPRLELEDPVHHEERVAVRDDLEDAADVEDPPAGPLGDPRDRPRHRDVALVAGPVGDDVRLHPAAHQRQVAQDVAGLVADEFVGPAQRAAEDLGLGEHHRRLGGAALEQAAVPSASTSWVKPKVRARAGRVRKLSR